MTTFSRSRVVLPLLLATGAIFTWSAQAPAQPAKPQTPKTTPKTTLKKRPKNLTPRVVKAIEAQTGAPLAPATKTKITAALRAREAAIEAANEDYYAALADLTGLSIEQVRAIDKPPRGTKANKVNQAAPTVKTPTAPKVETQTDIDELTTDDDETPAPVTPQN